MSDDQFEEEARQLLERSQPTVQQLRYFMQRVTAGALRFEATGERHTSEQEGWDDVARAVALSARVHATDGFAEALRKADERAKLPPVAGRSVKEIFDFAKAQRAERFEQRRQEKIPPLPPLPPIPPRSC